QGLGVAVGDGTLEGQEHEDDGLAVLEIVQGAGFPGSVGEGQVRNLLANGFYRGRWGIGEGGSGQQQAGGADQDWGQVQVTVHENPFSRWTEAVRGAGWWKTGRRDTLHPTPPAGGLFQLSHPGKGCPRRTASGGAARREPAGAGGTGFQ